jgi:photosystem II stability/assembly factor-like uncharacterized protein
MRWAMIAVLLPFLASACGDNAGDGTTAARIWIVADSLDAASFMSALLYSDDRGAHWNTAFTTTDELRAIAFSSPTVGIAVGRGVIVRTTTGGSKWSIVREVSGENVNSAVFSGTHGFAVGSVTSTGSSDRLVLETTDGGEHWEIATIPDRSPADVTAFPSPEMQAVCFSADDTALAVGLAFGALSGQPFPPPVRPQALRRDTTGWIDISDEFLPEGELNAVSCLDDGEIWAAGAGLFRSSDAGRTWSDESASLSSIGSPANGIVFADHLHGWVVGATPIALTPTTSLPRAFLAHTTDGGQSWVPATLGPDLQISSGLNAVALAPDASIVFAGGFAQPGGALGFVSTDGVRWRRTALSSADEIRSVVIVDRP